MLDCATWCQTTWPHASFQPVIFTLYRQSTLHVCPKIALKMLYTSFGRYMDWCWLEICAIYNAFYTAGFAMPRWTHQHQQRARPSLRLPVANTNSSQTSDCHAPPDDTVQETNMDFWCPLTDTFVQARPCPQREAVCGADFVVAHSYWINQQVKFKAIRQVCRCRSHKALEDFV
jgi:hypothetical protein